VSTIVRRGETTLSTDFGRNGVHMAIQVQASRDVDDDRPEATGRPVSDKTKIQGNGLPGKRSRAEGDSCSETNQAWQLDGRSSRHTARGKPEWRVGVVGRMALA
jgi:hypothetical protein